MLQVPRSFSSWLVNLPDPLTYPPHKQGFNKALLRETIGSAQIILATYWDLGWFGRDAIETLKAKKAVCWQPTEV